MLYSIESYQNFITIKWCQRFQSAFLIGQMQLNIIAYATAPQSYPRRKVCKKLSNFVYQRKKSAIFGFAVFYFLFSEPNLVERLRLFAKSPEKLELFIIQLVCLSVSASDLDLINIGAFP